MLNKKQKPLSAEICLKCFVCHEHEARHICNFEWNGIDFKLCLCTQCVALSAKRPATDMIQKVA